MHITSCIVHARPENAASVQTALEEFEGVEVHGGQEQGKLIVTVEVPQGAEAADIISKFHDVKGVANAVMVYHHNEEDEPN